MRRGMTPFMGMDRSGRVVVIATGADFCAEHEQGSSALMQLLTGRGDVTARDVADMLRDGGQAGSPAAGQLPKLEALRAIKPLKEELFWHEGEDQGAAWAALLCGPPWVWERARKSGRLDVGLLTGELGFRAGRTNGIAGAWNSESFGFRVGGEKQVLALKAFVEAMRGGQCILAGSFLREWDGTRLSGVIIARQDLLQPEHRSMMVEAQQQFEAEVRLHLRSRLHELQELIRQHGKSPGYLWSVWRGGRVDGEVAYALNPGWGVDARYYGPYGFEQLREWIVSGGRSALKTELAVA